MTQPNILSPKKPSELALPDAPIAITRNEMFYAFNQGDKFVLTIVLVNEDDSNEGPYYIRLPFDREPGWGVSSINYNLSDLLSKAEAMNG
jgi:hypothetical protein